MLKKFLIGAFFVAAFALVASSASADCTITTTLRVGSKGAEVSCLQAKVGATADGSFGPLTKASVMAYQSNHGLSADGVVGPLSRAVLNAGGSVSGNFPAGCTSAAGFSSVTGLACASVNANTFAPAGCTSASGFSPVTGGACYAVNSVVAGCSVGALFSSTTGLSCTGAVVVAPTSPLAGGAGDMTPTKISTDVETTVAAGDTEKVYGFKVQATDSDIALKNIKVTLENTPSGTGSSYRLNNYADEVSVYMGSTKVGSASVADFTKDGNIYSKSIALSDAVVRMGASNKATFYVEVTALSNIDSGDVGKNHWDITVDNIRFQDATGVIMTSTTDLSPNTFVFSDTSTDLKVVVSKGTSSPLAGNIEVSDTASTKDVLMLEFKVKATGSDVTFDSINVTPTATVSTIGNIVGELQLRNGSDTLATIDGGTLTSGASKAFNLDNTFTVSKDTTETFRVYATINDQSNFTAGSTLKVSYTDGTNAFAPEDLNGNTVDPTGSAEGYAQKFTIAGAAVTYVSDSYTAYDNSASAEGTISMKFTVAAFGDTDVTINTDQLAEAANASRGAGTAGLGYIVYTVEGAVGSGSIVTSSTTTAVANVFTVSAGSTETFTLSAKVGASTGFVIMHVTSVDGTAVTNIQTGAH